MTAFYNEAIENPTVSPNGDFIAFVRSSMTGEGRELWVMKRGGSRRDVASDYGRFAQEA